MERIAIIVGKMDSGGKKNLIMEYYRHIDRNEFQFDFICDSDSQAIPEKEIEELGGRVFIVPPYQKILSNMKGMKDVFKNNNYKIVHAYNSTMNVFSMYIAKKCKIPVRISESLSMAHKGDWKTIIKKILKPMSKWFANYYMACGNECGVWQFGKKLFDSGKVEVFKTCINGEFNRFDPEIRERCRKENGWQDKLVVGHIGRFTEQKNSVRLIEIFAEIAKQNDSAVMCLIGDGKLKGEMFNKIDELGIRDKVFYLGRREDIQQFYNAMDIFLLPSLYEGLPVVGLEAECCGLPILFSSEVTQEASVCELGQFLDLNKTNLEWAQLALQMSNLNTERRSRISEIEANGFGSKTEAARLQDYYKKLIDKEVYGDEKNRISNKL